MICCKRLRENVVFMSCDLACYKFTTAGGCKKVIGQFCDYSENIVFSSVKKNALVTNYFVCTTRIIYFK